jgi:hypothetical protein
LAKDFENVAETLATFVTLASIQLALRRFARAYVVNANQRLQRTMMKVCKRMLRIRSPERAATTATRRFRPFT